MLLSFGPNQFKQFRLLEVKVANMFTALGYYG